MSFQQYLRYWRENGTIVFSTLGNIMEIKFGFAGMELPQLAYLGMSYFLLHCRGSAGNAGMNTIVSVNLTGKT